MELPQKNLVHFFTDSEIPQVVIIHVGSRKFISNSIILALHSDQFESIISSGSKEIILDEFKGGCEAVRHSLMFMHGNTASVQNINEIVGMCQFAVVCQVPLLWKACINEIAYHLLNYPSKLFFFHTILEFTESNSIYHSQLEKLFRATILVNGNYLINYILKSHGTEELDLDNIDEVLLEALITHSKSPSCGELLLKLLSLSDHSKSFVLRSLDKIPLSTTFINETKFISFIDLLSPFIDEQKMIDDYRNILLVFQQRYYYLLCHKGKDNIKTEKGASADSKKQPTAGKSDGHLVDHNGDKNTVLSEPNSTLFTFWNSKSLTLLRAGIKKYPLYSQLEIVMYKIQKCKLGLTRKNLKTLITPFAESKMISVTLMNDLLQILPNHCSTGTLENDWLHCDISEEFETFHICRTFSGACMQKFVSDLQDFGRITLYKNFKYPCEIESCAQVNHKLGCNLEIEFKDAGYGISFSCPHQEFIVHCYMLGSDKDNSILSYTSLYQWTKSEIVEIVKAYSRVQIKIIYSKKCELRTNIMVPRDGQGL